MENDTVLTSYKKQLSVLNETSGASFVYKKLGEKYSKTTIWRLLNGLNKKVDLNILIDMERIGLLKPWGIK